MGIYEELFDFAASAGAFEGYVYQGRGRDTGYLPRWSENLVRQYQALPPEIRAGIQHMCDGTLGRALLSLVPVLGEDHDVIKNLRQMIRGRLPKSPDDFNKH